MKTIEDLKIIKEKKQAEFLDLLENKTIIYVHLGTCGIASGAKEILLKVKSLAKELNLLKDIKIVTTGCVGMCSIEPAITVKTKGTEPVIYGNLDNETVERIFKSHILKNKVLKTLAFARGMEYQINDCKNNKINEKVLNEDVPKIEDIPYFNLQKQIVMRNRGVLDPNKIEEYISRNGYFALAKALNEMDSDQIIQTILDSGLKGRGGAGFPTGLKWKYAKEQISDIKYVLCNADEGDPGAYMDRSVLESDPHSVIEGLIIAGLAIGANKGYIYCRAEYPLAVQTLNMAIKQARTYGLLGENILGSNFSFDLEVYEGAGAFVCGEETALMRSIEGLRGNPRPRPPFPAEKGLWDKPTTLNNVETLANISPIILNGAKWFSNIGTKNSKGTKVFSITGDINNVGCVEVPMGTKLETVIYDIGGGMTKGKNFKAAQLGGPSGGCIPKQHLDVEIDYQNLQKYGAIMGSGGLIVMCDEKSAVDIAKFFMEFCQDEACGKCIPGREGTKQMLILLKKICENKGTFKDLEKLKDLAPLVQKTALCALCKTAPNPVLSTMRYFENEYIDAVSKNSEVEK